MMRRLHLAVRVRLAIRYARGLSRSPIRPPPSASGTRRGHGSTESCECHEALRARSSSFDSLDK